MERITNIETGKFRHFSMDEDEYTELTGDYIGLCVACGATCDCVEPDAERYNCNECDRDYVYGTEQLLLMGRIVLGKR